MALSERGGGLASQSRIACKIGRIENIFYEVHTTNFETVLAVTRCHQLIQEDDMTSFGHASQLSNSLYELVDVRRRHPTAVLAALKSFHEFSTMICRNVSP